MELIADGGAGGGNERGAMGRVVVEDIVVSSGGGLRSSAIPVLNQYHSEISTSTLVLRWVAPAPVSGVC
eukprot:2956187-Rhodomonas_salina.1